MCLRAEGSRKAQGSIKVTSGACDYDVCLFWEFLANVEKNFFVEKRVTEKGNGNGNGNGNGSSPVRITRTSLRSGFYYWSLTVMTVRGFMTTLI